jgi:hypothetical protein
LGTRFATSPETAHGPFASCRCSSVAADTCGKTFRGSVAALAAELPDVTIEVTLPAGDDSAVQRCLASYCLRAARRGAAGKV